jgi:acyl-CoA dehydrogenase
MSNLALYSTKRPFETDERRAFRETVRRFVRNEVRPHVDAWDEAGEIPWELHLKAGALGFFGLGVDERYGGLGADDCFMRAARSEEFGQCGANGVPASLLGRDIAVMPIHALASESIKMRVLPPVVSGEKGACLAVTEPGAGSDVANLQTRAMRRGGEYILNGAKTFISGGMNSTYFVVAARTGGAGLDGISLFLVERGTPGFAQVRIERKMGWWCSDTASLFFDDCRIPAENLLGAQDRGFLAIMDNFNLERLSLTAAALGSAKLCLEEAVGYAQERETFGRKLIKHQVIRHKIAEMSARIDALEALLDRICWLVNERETPVAQICKAKFFGTKVFEFCASEAMQILGGAGYLRGNVVERMYREVKVVAIGGGSEEIMRDLAVRQMER